MPSQPATSSSPRLYATVLVVLAFALGYFYYSQSAKLDEAPVPASPIGDHDTLDQFKNLNLNFSTFSDPAYQQLIIYGQVPVTPGPTGKRDIFAPF